MSRYLSGFKIPVPNGEAREEQQLLRGEKMVGLIWVGFHVPVGLPRRGPGPRGDRFMVQERPG